MYVIDWTKIWQCQNPGQSLDLAIQSGTAIVDTDNFISLLIEKSPISYDSTVLRWIADFVRERDPNYVISWPDVLGPEGQLDNEQKALLKEGSGAIPGPAETKSMGKIVSEGVNQPAFKIGGMYILYSFAINFPNLIYLAIALWLLKNFKDFFEENSAGNGGNDGNDGNDGSGGSGGHGNKGTGNSDGDDKGGTKGPKASKKDDDNKDNKDKDDESRDSNKKRGSRWGFSVRGNPFVTVDPITGQQSFQFRFPSSEAEPTENPIPRFRPRSPKPFTFEPNHPVEVVVQDAESQESEFGRDSVTSTPTYKNSQQKQKRDF